MRIHFISIGGSVMHQLAIALQNKGYIITGSDDEIFEPAKSNLKRVAIFPAKTGWDASKITKDLDAVILGMHAKEDNPELKQAIALQLNIYSFPEYIYKESLDKTRIVVGGSHGKTTTTSMIMHVMKETGRQFDYLVGARLEGFEQSVNITHAPIIVCEGDEYPASAIEIRPKFHFLHPHLAVLTGIAWDHINVFPTFENYLEQFAIFIKKIEKGGHLVYNQTDTILKDLVEKNKRTDLHYHPYDIPAHRIDNGVTTIEIENKRAGLKVFGNHNLLNLNAAWLICKEIGINASEFTTAIGNFRGAAKRLELLASNIDTIIYRDFAHAPSKVKATINAVKEQFPSKKMIGILELHTYSSLNETFIKEYDGVMNEADKAVVFYSKHALELKRLPELKREIVKNGFNTDGLEVFNEKKELESWLDQLDLKNTVIVFMSSGNYDGLILEDFAKRVI